MLNQLLRRELSSIGFATFCSLTLGIVTTLLFALIGPALQTVESGADTKLIFKDLLGPWLGAAAASISGREYVLGGDLWQYLPISIIGLAVTRALLGSGQWFLWEKTSEKIAKALRAQVVDRYLGLNPKIYFEKRNFDEHLSSLLTTDVKFLREYIVHFYGGFPRELIQVILYLITAALLSPKLFVIFFLGIGPAGAILSRLGKKIRKRAGQALDSYGELSEWLQQRLLGVETIKHYRTELEEYRKMEEQTGKLNLKFLKTVRVKARTNPILEIIAVLALVVVLYAALDMVGSQEVSGSVMMSFFSILGIMVQSASKLGRYYNSNKEGAAAVDRLTSFIQATNGYESQAKPGNSTHESSSNLIQLEEVHLTYPGREEPALSGINLSLKSGELVCIAGPSGAGKSSLFSLLLGLIQPSQGVYSLRRGIDRSSIAYLPQNILLAPVSIAQNIAYPDASVDESKLESALEKAALSGVFTKEQLFLDPEAEGPGLSGGQMQRVMLARVFYHQSALVFIDEGTSAIDPENESLIIESIRRLCREGSTVVMIAHRQASIQAADRVITLENGRLV